MRAAPQCQPLSSAQPASPGAAASSAPAPQVFGGREFAAVMLAGPQKASRAPAIKGPLAHGQGIGRLELLPPGGGAHGNQGLMGAAEQAPPATPPALDPRTASSQNRLPRPAPGNPAQALSGKVLSGSPFRQPSKSQSGRQDSNLRPSAPKAPALPSCATPRLLECSG